MAKYTGADCRLCRREGTKLFLKGDRCTSKKCAIDRRPTPPGIHGMGRRRRMSEYGLQLREKQKTKRYYGLVEKQFKNYYIKASRQKGVTGEIMLSMLERRLDNVVYRMGIGFSRAQARQIVNHGHITVNGKKVDIPSYQVNVGDVIAIKPARKEKFAHLKEYRPIIPKWLDFSTETLEGKVLALPAREDIDLNINEQLIVEHYSK
ncbi:MAG TPA: 30S ribosomal protein S4 [Clostridiales bacterium]|jgi:small subunit ribosomal protein S4|nr:30S ribosomal protein S4 [Clostridiales bacterium]